MYRVVLSILFLVPMLLRAQTDPAVLDSATVSYFEEEGVTFDSCNTSALYGEVCTWIDTPYLYAGRDRWGIDCSGFTKEILKKVYNIELQGGSQSLYEQCVPIEKEYLEEGDLVFFKIGSNRISHVGVYLRNGQFVHASSHLGVIVSSLDEKYYQKYFFSGGRIIVPTNEQITSNE